MSAEPVPTAPSTLELDLLAAALAHDPDGVALVDPHGHVWWHNRHAASWVRETRALQEVVAWPVHEARVHPLLGEMSVHPLPSSGTAPLYLVRHAEPQVRQRHLDLLRHLHTLTSERRLTLEQRLKAIFELGIEHFGLSRAVQSRVEGRFHVVERCLDPTGHTHVGMEHPLNQTWCHHTLRQNKPVSVHHASASDHREKRYRQAFPYEAYLGAPVFVDAVRIGTLAFASDDPVAPFDASDRVMVGLLAQWVGHELAREHDRSMYLKAQEDLGRMARTDVLTKLPNRRAILEALHWQVAYARRAHLPLSIVLLDLDHFKRINDHFGHEGGDIVLKAFSDLLRKVKRETDLAGRWGGEEFLLVLPNTEPAGARVFCDRLHHALQDFDVPMPNGGVAEVRASMGAARVWTTEREDAAISRADAALYRAKKGGRNRLVVDIGATPAPEPRLVRPERQRR